MTKVFSRESRDLMAPHINELRPSSSAGILQMGFCVEQIKTSERKITSPSSCRSYVSVHLVVSGHKQNKNKTTSPQGT